MNSRNERENSSLSLSDTWRKFKAQNILLELPKRLAVVTEIEGRFGQTDGLELSIVNPQRRLFIRKKPEGWEHLESFSIIRELIATAISEIPSKSGSRTTYVEKKFYTLAFDIHGFYGRYRDHGAVFLGDEAAIGNSIRLRSRVFEHIENEKGGRKTLLSWAKESNPYIR